jgi:hypothetical protein
MSPSTEGRITHAPPLSEAHWLLRFVCTSNPFYVISAGLFLAGLWLSCDPEKAEDTWMLMGGLVAYTLLLAGTAYLLIRHAGVWDDARTVLLLVVFMFLATSVTFDRRLVFETRFGDHTIPVLAITCNLLGLIFAIILSEVLLRGVHLSLGVWYRGPYYLLLGLFFLYPLALVPFINDNAFEHTEMMWGLYAFLPIAGLIFLTLIPAIRHGAAYVRDNGSPWPWPLYPWSLFGMLAFAVPCRALLMSYSLLLIDVRDLYEATFGLYFLAPFGLALAVLLLEAGLVTRRDGILWSALAIPLLLVALSMFGHRDERIYERFLKVFMDLFGCGPLYVSFLGAAAFYAYACMRRVRGAIEALMGTLAVVMFVDPQSITPTLDDIVAPQSAPLIAIATMLLGLGIWQRTSWRCLAGALGLVLGLMLAFPIDVVLSPYRWMIAFHVALLATLLIGAAYEDELAQALRFIVPFVALVVALAVLVLPMRFPASLPPWVLPIYPLAICVLLGMYGFWMRHTSVLGMAVLLLAAWSLVSGWQIYRVCRQLVIGLDYLVLSLMIFVIAAGISLAKSGLIARWLHERRAKTPD